MSSAMDNGKDWRWVWKSNPTNGIAEDLSSSAGEVWLGAQPSYFRFQTSIPNSRSAQYGSNFSQAFFLDGCASTATPLAVRTDSSISLVGSPSPRKGTRPHTSTCTRFSASLYSIQGTTRKSLELALSQSTRNCSRRSAVKPRSCSVIIRTRQPWFRNLALSSSSDQLPS